jgi:hypothetical protein
MWVARTGNPSSSLRSWIEASSILAAALYAFGWILTARFLAKFGVSPEEVGFSFAYLIIRVAFIVMAFVAVAGGLFWTLSRLAEYGESTRIKLPRASVRNAVQLTLVLVGIVGNILLVAQVVADGVSWVGLVAIPVVVAVWTGVIVIFARRLLGKRVGPMWATEYYESLGFSMKTFLRIVSVVFVLAVIVGLMGVPFLAADRYADQVEAGEELRTPVLPGITGLSAQLVQTTTVDDEPLSATLGRSACLHLLGSAGGVAVLYDHASDTVIRVPQERVSLEHPCT